MRKAILGLLLLGLLLGYSCGGPQTPLTDPAVPLAYWHIYTVTTDMVAGHTSLKVVDNRPAIVYHGGPNSDLMYVRAGDGIGSTWPLPFPIDGPSIGPNEVGLDTSLDLLADGRPAVSYVDATSGHLKYVRAFDLAGNLWSLPVDLGTAGNPGASVSGTSLEIVAGNPAISFSDGLAIPGGSSLYYLRSMTPEGDQSSAWAQLVRVDDTFVGKFSSLAVWEGSPAISYYDEGLGHLKFAQSSSITGGQSIDWLVVSNSVDPTPGANAGAYTSLLVVGTNPSVPVISYYDSTNECLKFSKGNVNQGPLAWDAPLALDTTAPGFQIGMWTSMARINGLPAISYFDLHGQDLKYIQALDEYGTSWSAPSVIDGPGSVGSYSSLTEVQGHPAISYWDVTSSSLKYAVYYEDTAIN